jgi:hypothetical protein
VLPKFKVRSKDDSGSSKLNLIYMLARNNRRATNLIVLGSELLYFALLLIHLNMYAYTRCLMLIRLAFVIP